MWVCEIICLFIDGLVFPDVTMHRPASKVHYMLMEFSCLEGPFSTFLPMKVQCVVQNTCNLLYLIPFGALRPLPTCLSSFTDCVYRWFPKVFVSEPLTLLKIIEDPKEFVFMWIINICYKEVKIENF